MRTSPKQKLWALMQLFLISVLAGGLLAVPMMLPVAMTGKATDAGIDFWNSLPAELVSEPLPQRSRILDRNGDLIAEFYSENRVNVKFEDISENMRSAIISIEDDRFYEHGAVDAKGTIRGLVKTVIGGSIQGGSTLTQQYVKNVLLYNADTKEEQEAATEQTIARKIREMKLAQGIEQKMTKNEILTGYLNIANFGDGSFGVGAAAMHYFGVSAKDLTLEQAALLAGLVQNPVYLNPVKYPEEAKNRRDVVLMRMQKTGRITMEQKHAAQAKPIVLNVTQQKNGCISSKYPLFCQMVRNTLANNSAFGETETIRQRFLYRGGLTIKTTLDPKAQHAVQKATMEALGSDNQYAASMALVQPGTGQVLAIGQNREFGEGPGKTYVNYATSGFQNGSTFKPITLMAAMENGWSIDQKMDVPYHWCAPSPNQGCFDNMSAAQGGNIDAVRALEVSSNNFFTKLSVQTGTDKVQQMARRLGIDIPESATGHETSTTLGVYDVSPIDLANAYATIAAHGVHCNANWITSITDSSGKSVKIPEANCHQEVAPDIADKVAKAMTNVIDGPNPNRSGAKLSLGRPAMGKTGTTNDNSAVWFAGGTPQYQAAVWVGDPRGGFKYPVENLRIYGEVINGIYGSTASGPVWKSAMTEILKDVPPQDFTVSSTTSSNRQEVLVPDVSGMKVSEAIATVKRSGMRVLISPKNAEPNEAFQPNTVVAQSIKAGTPQPLGKEITLTLSNSSDPVKT